MTNDTESADMSSANYVLYWCSYSIRSLQVLYTKALAGEPKGSGIHLERHWVDLMRGEQSEEWYLNVNPNGQVPVLSGQIDGRNRVIANTLEITYFLASKYPNLIPDAHADKIKRLLTDLHSIHFFSVSFDKLPFVGTNNLAGVRKRLEDPTVSDHYRKLLEHKIHVVDTTEVKTLEPAAKQQAQAQTRTLLADVEEILAASEGPWLFGESPTALDAHIVLFLARLTDVGKSDFISPALREYGRRAMQQSEYMKLMAGKGTMDVPP